jgi:hypothetical protein
MEMSKWEIKTPIIILNTFEPDLKPLKTLELGEYKILNPEKEGYNKIPKLLNQMLKI